MDIVAFANQKGGVGKTTTVVNIGTALAAAGKRILIIDLDPQGNASTGFGLREEIRNRNSYDLLLGAASIREACHACAVPGLQVVPATDALVGADVELTQIAQRSYLLRNALARLNPAELDMVLIDCPPSLGVLVVNALAAADSVVVPVQCEYYALEGYVKINNTINKVKTNLNPRLMAIDVLLTMVDNRTSISREIVANARKYLGDKVMQTEVPRNVRLAEAPSHGLPAILYDPKCLGSRAYIAAARELRDRLAARRRPLGGTGI